MTRVLLARHGVTDWNSQSRLQGQSDLSLSQAGLSQALALARRLSEERLDQVWVSDLQRARQTADVVLKANQHSQPRLRVEPGLREISFGEWEGLTFAEIEQRDPQGVSAWQADLRSFSPPGGESLSQMAGRVAALLEGIRQAPAQETLLLVAHGGPLQMLLCLALGLPPENYWTLHLEPASLSELNLYPAGPILNRLNDTCHLA